MQMNFLSAYNCKSKNSYHVRLNPVNYNNICLFINLQTIFLKTQFILLKYISTTILLFMLNKSIFKSVITCCGDQLYMNNNYLNSKDCNQELMVVNFIFKCSF